MQNVLVIDNYDSFTFNLVHLIGPLCATIEVARNDALTVSDIRNRAPDAIVLSPGPCTPNEAGICLDVVRELSAETPIFGVCLGLQAIGQAFGGDVVRAPLPLHGKVSTIRHGARGLFRGLNDSFEATRYHSLVVDRATCPAALSVTAEADGLIMALEHAERPVHGVQFHPESIRSQHGAEIVRNFLELAAAWNAARDKRRPPVH
jgi:anthranilate synthase component II